ncbi:hypothetical protein ES15_1698 [Cronobacter sakazakii ES15]|uniref:Uncharacterized protein n=1 Tax=Cronobacter sakazakii (strain ATCC BAA-894) TaxID=290339 RepID=A7MKD2_CROS8|nr:hypothetical protein ESA_01466 [Cronobacter sakazakii ATCC BAA-894]AFJ99271.1 hypothetical protein ES15_1698 [Cronobacter sakazakii ES15]AKE95720.1 hypothetical protein CSK29544_02769 [Cronobacter sakazakii]CCJ98522.1 hypothetical protein BN130_1098 [Cronobacter malonaticus 507]CCK02924.1 hypothetical protein BN129_1508 [Cronobacter sakazakii 701]CCK07343.1 hypothetical protein BN128_1266 [Cronobacter sakazakii 696]
MILYGYFSLTCQGTRQWCGNQAAGAYGGPVGIVKNRTTIPFFTFRHAICAPARLV